MAKFDHFDSILELGKKIVDELGLEHSTDTLARWMAHYVAELISAAEAADIEDRPERLRACADVVLDLWKHKSDLPNGRRPFEDIESIGRALETLSPETNALRYFREIQEATGSESDSESKHWLDLGHEVDRSARFLIGHCMRRAGAEAVDKAKPWVMLAQSAGIDDGAEVEIIRFLSEESDSAEHDRIAERIRLLEALTALVRNVLEELRGKVTT